MRHLVYQACYIGVENPNDAFFYSLDEDNNKDENEEMFSFKFYRQYKSAEEDALYTYLYKAADEDEGIMSADDAYDHFDAHED